ncbi:MAG: type II toxin-antitoxin system VapC family toxin [Cyclobacteriaceae bacterium]|jgi:tRNA(fMet)-specific endonuclease VapC|nr:type II toxin-antitoxin system VapC family toxin [Flammeovirgaceae bacterium]
METRSVVVDTSVLIEYLRAKDKTKTTLQRLPDHFQIFISAITLYELLMGGRNHEKWNEVRRLIEDIPVLPFDHDVAEQAARIYHQLKKLNRLIEFRDLFIAAAALAREMPVLTLNRKDFSRIKNLELVE